MTVSRQPRDKVSRFRITAWPGTTIPLPPVRSRDVRLEEGILLPNLLAGSQGWRTEESVAGEIYLRLLELDTRDDGAILEFVRQYGLLGVIDPFREYPFFETLPDLGGAIYNAFRKERKRAASTIAQQEHDQAEVVARALDIDGPAEGEGLWTDVETVTEFRVGAFYLRDAARAWIAIREGSDLGEVGFESPLRFEMGERPHLALDDYFDSFFRSALEPFHPALRLEVDVEDDTGTELPHRLEVVPAPDPDGKPLYSVCAAELYNHIVEQAEYRICGRETCGRRFVRHHGRSRYGQHRREGIKYCSATCARAEAQRAYRVRRATEKSSRSTAD
jgi:hypothetical protein